MSKKLTKTELNKLKIDTIEQLKKLNMGKVKRDNMIFNINNGYKPDLTRAIKYIKTVSEIPKTDKPITDKDIKTYKKKVEIKTKIKREKAQTKREKQAILKNNPLLLQKLSEKFAKGSKKMQHFDADHAVKLTGLKVEGATSNIVAYKISYEKEVKPQSVQKIATRFSNFLKEQKINGKIACSMNIGNRNWRSGDFTKIGEHLDIYKAFVDSDGNGHEPLPTKDIVMYFYEDEDREDGGSDLRYNDCLHDCLKYFFPVNPNLPTAEGLKQYLKLNRMDRININHIPQIESLMNIKIDVFGEATYASPSKSTKYIQLSLTKRHYTPYVETKKKLFTNGRGTNCKIILENEKGERYDGKHLFTELSEQELINIRVLRNTMLVKNKYDLPLDKAYTQYIKDADFLLKETNGLINMYQYDSDKNLALELFKKLSTRFQEPEPLTPLEHKFISQSALGAMFYSEPGQYMNATKYDIKSAYPYLLQQSTNKIAVKQGEFIHLEELPEILQYGIYHCEITGSCKKYFRFNTKHNMYTSIDVRLALSLKLNVELIQDGECNALIYTREKLLTTSQMFKDYVDYLYPLKDKTVMAKRLINIIWGALFEKLIVKKFIKDDDEHVIPANHVIPHISPCSYHANTTSIRTYDNDNIYKTNYARIGPFLLAAGRNMISKLVQKYDVNDNIKWIHTDGFLTTEDVDVEIGNKIGSLAIECNGNCQVHNVNNITYLNETRKFKKNSIKN